MTVRFSDGKHFTFEQRPVPVPGDLRIGWRLALILLMLEGSRQHRASLIKLHILNDAVRSETSQEQLRRIIDGQLSEMFWRTRVEPAFGRALDFVIGEGLAGWVHTTLGRGLKLTQKGLAAVEGIRSLDATLEAEKTNLAAVAVSMTEKFAKRLTSAQVN